MDEELEELKLVVGRRGKEETFGLKENVLSNEKELESYQKRL